MRKTKDYADIMTELVETGISETEAYTFITYLMGYDQGHDNGYSKGVKSGAIIVLVLAVVVFKVLQLGGLL